MAALEQFWLFIRGPQSVRITKLPLALAVVVRGPGSTEGTHRFQNEGALDDFLHGYRCRLVAEGWSLQETERRVARADSVTPFAGERRGSTPSPNHTQSPARGTVLVVDDDPAVLALLKRSLESLGYAVMTADDQRSAESVLASEHIDALTLDLRLGERSGLDLLDSLRGRDDLARLPVLMLTGVTQMTEDEEETIRRNGAYVFYKPAPLGELRATLARVLDQAA
jgi:CheY-like chemotaxis protein